jgi:glucan phosphoethanolaminetransferase (alkaline phosphatase superfamily)
MPVIDKIVQDLNTGLVYKRWKLVKYALVAFFTFLPGLTRFLNYFVPECLLTFFAFLCLMFAVMTLFRLNRRWFIPTIAVGIFGASYQLAIGKPVGYQILNAMFETNHREMLGFLYSPYSIPLLLGGAVALGLALWIIVGERPLPWLHKATMLRRKYIFGLMFVSLALFLVTNWRVYQTYPVCLFYNNYVYFDEKFSLADYKAMDYTPSPSNCLQEPEDETIVLIIGESARRRSHSAYGYAQQTTTRLDGFLHSNPDRVILFTDAITTSAFTKASVMSIYSPLTLP